MILTDNPITSRDHDELQRAVFVRSLGRSLLAHTNKESLVIALDGPFGSGKSSLLNLLHEEFRIAIKYSLDTDKPVVMDFNPWYLADNIDIAKIFFEQLIATIEETEYLQQAKQVAKKLTEYYLQCKNEKEIITVPQLKTELDLLFAKQSHKIIITVDNITQLSTRNITKLLQIIKYLANFPNTIFVLAYDKQVMIKVLANIETTDSAQYLDGIVQISLPIPTITPQMLETILLSNLKQLLQLDQKEWDDEDWHRLYQGGFKKLFTNMRDISRYLNMLDFVYHWLEIEVNHIDLVTITALQIFEPNVYEAIKNNKDLFTYFLKDTFPNESLVLAEEKERLDIILHSARILSAQDLRDLLTQLFPKLNAIYEQHNFDNEDFADWRRKHRICDSDTFDRFFSLALTVDHMTENEAKTIIEALGKEPVFDETIKALIENKRALSFFEFFTDYLPNKIKPSQNKYALKTLLDCGDILPEFEHAFVNYNIPLHIYQIAHQLLSKFKASQDRFTALEYAYENITLSLYIPIQLLVYLQEAKLLQVEQLRKLQTKMVKQIELWAGDGRLIEHPHLPEILTAWKKWSGKTTDTKFISALIKTDESLIKFLLAFMRPAVLTFMHDLTKKPEWQLNLDKIAKFIPLEVIEPRIGKIYEDSSVFRKLREREQVAILIFLECRQQG